MIRTFALAVAIAALAVAGPSWAGVRGPDQQQASSASSPAGGGGPLLTQGAQTGVTGDEQFVTGKVVMTTPTEIVLHTDQGMQRFALSTEMQNNGYMPAEGDTVTLGYVTAAGTSRVNKITRAAEETTAAPAASDQTQTASTSPAGDSQQTPPENKPDVSPAPAAMATSANEPEARSDDAGKHAAQLPKTASNRPLILLIGVLALAAAAVVRFAARA